ncbi:response regulator [Paenibacillus phytohabitans]|uniref:response regulator n=1 Tax=Paenibacillus phytohabitans TaxID=2654978 RepID=UPI00300BEB32
MLKAVIFDDEHIVLQGLQQIIEWERYGIELVGTAEDGLAALQLVRKCKPDIIFTDIRMPGMDGLQLIEIVAAEAPWTMFIVFSGFNEFEYVRRAIGLGVVDYLEKPVTIAKIEESLGRTITKIGKEQAFSEMKTKLDESREKLLEKSTLDLLLAGGQVEQEWKDTFGEEWANVVAVTVLAFPDKQIPLTEHSSYCIVPVANGNQQLAVVLHRDTSSNALDEELISISGLITGTFGSGRTYKSINDASRSYREALRALRYGQFLEQSGWVRIVDVEGRDEQLPLDLSSQEETVIVSLRMGDRDWLCQTIDDLKVWTEGQKLTPERVEQELVKLMYLGLEVAKEMGCSPSDLADIHPLELQHLNTRDNMFLWLRAKLELLLSWANGARRTPRHPAVEKVLMYMNEHYGEDLSLQDLAQYVGLNPTYFSLLFKEQMEISYIKYLTGIRIERAKAMLKEGYRVNEVSEKVGYLNYRHFTEIFKKMVGTTPGQYRDAHHTKK